MNGAPQVKRRRAKCLYCGKPKPVTKAGKIRKHWVTGGSGRPA